MAAVTPTPRLVALDAARGAAMMFVCISHFGHGLKTLKPYLSVMLARIGMVATPSFVLLSGIVMGYLWSRSSDGGRLLRWKLADRGLFLLTVGHLLITLPHLLLGHPQAEWLSVPITDALGFAMIAGAVLSARCAPRAFLAIGGGLYLLAWLFYFWWNPKPLFLHALSELLVGQTSAPHVLGGVFPLLPLAGVYFCAVPLGAWMASAMLTGLPDGMRRLRIACVMAIVLALCLGLVARTLAPEWTGLQQVLSLYQKYPPGPAYLLFFGACGLTMVSFFLQAGARWPDSRVMGVFAMVGRSSLFVFLAQYYVYYIFFPLLGPGLAQWWPVALMLSLAFLVAAAALWSRRGLNRWLTLGLSPARNPIAA